MERFIQLVGQNNYDKLVENGKIQKDNFKNELPFADLVPVVRIICPYQKDRGYKHENDFCLLTEVNGEAYNDAAVYGLHTFRTGFPEIGILMIQDIVEFRGYNNITFQLDEEFKPEKTLREYLNYYSFRLNGLPRTLWHHINKKEEVKKFHQRELEMIKQEEKIELRSDLGFPEE